MTVYLLDTTILIDALRGRAAAARLRTMRTSDEVPFVCAINVEELVRGLRPDEGGPAGRFLAGLRIAPLGREEGSLAGRWRRAHAARGITLTQADCLIAAAAAGVDAVLATGNPKDFPMPQVVVKHWPVGA